MGYTAPVEPITTELGIQPGDVLYHPAMGFARVELVGPGGYELAWETQSRRFPRKVTRAGVLQAYQRCEADGFFARALTDREALKGLVAEHPHRGAAMLLAELEGPQDRESLRRWLTTRALIDEGGFEAWWSTLRQSQHPALTFRGDRVSLVGGDDEDTEAETGADDDAQTAQERAAPLEGIDALGAVSGEALLRLGESLLSELALQHLSGHGVGLRPRMIQLEPSGEVRLRDLERGDPADDLRAAGYLLFERLFDRPLPGDPARLLRYVAALAPALPPSAVPLLEELVVRDEALISIDSLALARGWAQARTQERLRGLAPLRVERSLQLGADTHVGRAKMLTHQTNQDAFARVGSGRRGALIVADGISICDTGSGDEASRVATRTLSQLLTDYELPDDPERSRERLGAILERANQAVCDATLARCGGDLTGRIPMGTTLVFAVFDGPLIDIVSMGDSPALLAGPCGVGQLTPDHNVELERLMGKRAPYGDSGAALTSFLGAFNFRDKPELQPFFFRRLRLLPGEHLILVSDGVTDYAASSDVELHRLIAELAEACDDAQELATALVEAANQGGGGDNTTAAVAWLPAEG